MILVECNMPAPRGFVIRKQFFSSPKTILRNGFKLGKKQNKTRTPQKIKRRTRIVARLRVAKKTSSIRSFSAYTPGFRTSFLRLRGTPKSGFRSSPKFCVGSTITATSHVPLSTLSTKYERHPFPLMASHPISEQGKHNQTVSTIRPFFDNPTAFFLKLPDEFWYCDKKKR